MALPLLDRLNSTIGTSAVPFMAIAIVGTISLATRLYNILDFFYLYFLKSHGTKRYLRSPSKSTSSSSVSQNNRAWALVTGASDGVGFATVNELAVNGFNVVLHGRNPTKLKSRLVTLESQYPSTSFRIVIADTYDSSNMTERIFAIVAKMAALPGPLRVLVNNAGGLPFGSTWNSFAETSANDIAATIALSIRFPTKLKHALLPLLKKHSPALVIVVGSGSGDASPPCVKVYGGIKPTCSHGRKPWQPNMPSRVQTSKCLEST